MTASATYGSRPGWIAAPAVCVLLIAWGASRAAPAPEAIDLDRAWSTRADPDGRGTGRGWATEALDDSAWELVDLGASRSLPAAAGPRVLWYRKRIVVPGAWRGGTVYLGVARARSAYRLFINGRPVGSREAPERSPHAQGVHRVEGCVRFGARNLVAIRVESGEERIGIEGGVRLSNDKRAFDREPLRIDLSGPWRFRIDPEDRGIGEGWAGRAFDDAPWIDRAPGDPWNRWPEFRDYRGVAWYRRSFDVPADWEGERAYIFFRRIHGAYRIFLNGKAVAAHEGDGVPEGRWVRIESGRAHPLGEGDFGPKKQRPGERICIDVTGRILPGRRNAIAVRVRGAEGRRGISSETILLACDARVLEATDRWNIAGRLARSYPQWIWPRWATERGRTRTITGLEGDATEAFCAPDGSFSPANRSFSVTAWIYDRDRDVLHAPERLPLESLRWRLEEGWLPVPTTRWTAAGIEVETRLFVSAARRRAEWDLLPGEGIGAGTRGTAPGGETPPGGAGGAAGAIGRDRDEGVAFWRLRIRNRTASRRSLVLLVAIRSFALDQGYYMFHPGMNPVWELRFVPSWSTVLVNGRIGLVADRGPDAFGATSWLAGGDVSRFALEGRLPAAAAARDWLGLASGALRYRLDIEPGGDTVLAFKAPMHPWPAVEEAAAALRGIEEKRAFDRVRRGWRERLERVRVDLPDRRLADAFQASKAYMLILKDGDELIPGAFAYNAFWTRDAAYMIDACLRAGLEDVARKAAALFLEFQKPSGLFPSMGRGGPSEWDSQGEAIFSLVQVYRFTGDRRWLARCFPSILRGVRYLAEIRARRLGDAHRGTPFHGILPPGVSAEDLGPHDWHMYWDDFWGIRGLSDALFAARELGEEAAAREIEQELEGLRGATLASIRRVQREKGIDWIPVSPQGIDADGMLRGTTPAIWPGGALAPEDPLVRRSFDVYWDRFLERNDGGYLRGGRPWPYAAMSAAHAYVYLGEPDRALRMIEWLLRYETAPGVHAWAEMADGGRKLFLGGDIPHGWACAELVSLVRDMLVYEKGGALVLAGGVPREWLRHGERLSIGRAPTYFGDVDYGLESRLDGGVIELRFGDGHAADPPGGTFLRLPFPDARIRKVAVDGGVPRVPGTDLLRPPPGGDFAPLPGLWLRVPAGARRVRIEIEGAVERDPVEAAYRARMVLWRRGIDPRRSYASVDAERPLIGVYFYFNGPDERTDDARLASVREAFDFVQIAPRGSDVRRVERLRIPWMGVDQPAIPLGRADGRWGEARRVILDRTRSYRDAFYLLGWNGGSEPHTSYRTPAYTAHTRELYDSIGVAGHTREEFIEWLAGRYGDPGPAEDSSGDGITFNAEFGTGFRTWQEVARPENREPLRYAILQFRAKLIRDCVAGRQALFRLGDPDHAVSPRLLRSLDDPRMSIDLRYLELGDVVGVTLYAGGGANRPDPGRTGARAVVFGGKIDGAYRFGLAFTPPQAPLSGVVSADFTVRAAVAPEGASVRLHTFVRADGEADLLLRVLSLPRSRATLTEPGVQGSPDRGRLEGPWRVLLEARPAGVLAPLDLEIGRADGQDLELRIEVAPARPGTVPGRLILVEPRVYAVEGSRGRPPVKTRGAEAGPEAGRGRVVPPAGPVAQDRILLARLEDQARQAIFKTGYRLYGDAHPERAQGARRGPGDGAREARGPAPPSIAVPVPGPFVWTGFGGGQCQLAYLDHVASLVSNRASRAGKRWAANEFHPTSGSPEGMTETAIFLSAVRALRFRPTHLAYFCHSYQRDFTRFSLADVEPSIARLRNQLALWRIYPAVRRAAEAACFVPSFLPTPEAARAAARRLGTQSELVWTLGEVGAEFHLLSDLDRIEGFEKAVILLAYADAEAERKIRDLFDKGLSGRRIVAIAATDRLYAGVGRKVSRRFDASLEGILPAWPAGGGLVPRHVEIEGVELALSVAAEVGLAERRGFSPILARDGAVVGARSRDAIVLAGYPESGLRELLHAFLDLRPGRIDAGALQIVTADGRAGRPGVYAIENTALLEVPEGLAGYDILRRAPVRGLALGPTVVRVIAAGEARLVDTGLAEPLEVEEGGGAIRARLLVPRVLRPPAPLGTDLREGAGGSIRRSAHWVVWHGLHGQAEVDGRPVQPVDRGGGFRAVPIPEPGLHRLSIRG